MDPLRTLDLYFRNRQYADERRERLLQAAKDLMESVGA